MKKYLFLIFICLGCSPKENIAFLKSEQVQLSMTNIRAENIFFNSSTEVKYPNLGDGIKVRYTKDHKDPTEVSPLFNSDLNLTESSVFKFRAFGNNAQASNPQELRIFRMSATHGKIIEATAATKPYDGSTDILLDRRKGNKNFRSGKWLGYQEPVVELSIKLLEPSNLDKLVVSTLEDQGAWIFAPEKVEVEYTLTENNSVKKSKLLTTAGEESHSGMKYIELEGTSEQVSMIKLRIFTLSEIPSWHPGKGTPPWLFLDEIILQ